MPPQICEQTNKIPFSKNKAESVAKQMNHRQHDWPVHAYHCPICGCWHVGHVPSASVKKGKYK